MEDNYSKAYKEVIEVLKYVPQESVDKIPYDMIEMFKTNMDNNYEFKVDVNKSFEEQKLLEETKAIFANIFRDYWATPYQRERIKAKEKQERWKEEEEKRKKYNPDDIFKNKRNLHKVKIESLDNNSKNLPTIVEKEKFYQKLIKLIKIFLKWEK